MSKNRRKRWLWGALLTAIILFAAITLVTSRRGTQSRVDRLTADIVKESGLRLKESWPVEFLGVQTTIVTFEGAPHNADVADDIAKLMKDSFPNWKYTAEYRPATDEYPPPNDFPNCWVHTLQFGEPFQRNGWLIQYIPDDKGWGGPQRPIADFAVIGPSKVSLLERIKSWLPW